MKKYYPSAKSPGLGAILWAVLLASLGLGIFSSIKSGDINEMIIVSVISLLVIIFVAIIWFKTGYLVSKEYLDVKVGPVTVSKIKISSISKISRSNSILASPANSLKRLAIQSENEVLVQISPKEEESFLKVMTAINPKIAVEL